MRPDDSAALIRAYRSTSYQVLQPDDHDVVLAKANVGGRSRGIDRLLAGHGCQSGVFITAWNPRSRKRPRQLNDAAHHQLEEELRRRSVRTLPHLGVGADPAWKPEHGLFALDLPLLEALALAVAFGQNAVVLIEHGRPARLVTTELMPEV